MGSCANGPSSAPMGALGPILKYQGRIGEFSGILKCFDSTYENRKLRIFRVGFWLKIDSFLVLVKTWEGCSAPPRHNPMFWFVEHCGDLCTLSDGKVSRFDFAFWAVRFGPAVLSYKTHVTKLSSNLHRVTKFVQSIPLT